MASKKKLQGAALAESRVRQQGADSALIFSLPVNYDFAEPNVVDKERGVDYPDAPENRQAEQGTTRAVLAAMFPANLTQWIGQMARTRGGNEGLTRDLLAMKANPAAKSPQHDYDNMLRAIQRAGPAKKANREESHGKMSKALYRERVALLRLTQAKHLVIGARGWWQIEDEEKFRVFNSDPTEPRHVTEALEVFRADGAAFIETVISIAAEYVQPYAPELISTHELRVEVSA